MLDQQITQLIAQQRLPASFVDTVQHWYMPVAMEIAGKARQAAAPIVVGVQGAQGSGKSTLAAFLKALLESNHHLNTAVLSIDDFYLTHAARTQLGQTVHPLLCTRGVPGTHDVALAQRTINTLCQLKGSESTRIPRFDKSIDDRAPEEQWSNISGPVDVILLEGWCVGLNPQSDDALEPPINTLEAENDAQGLWRRYVNHKLSQEYAPLFNSFTFFVVLQAPSFDAVYQWRLLQEQKLIAKIKEENQTRAGIRTMSADEIRTFISHYQRLTEHALCTLPEKADYVLRLDSQHRILSTHTKDRSHQQKAPL